MRRRWFRWLVLPVALMVVAHAAWTLTLKWEFDARLEDLRGAGEPVDLLDVAPPPVPDSDNAAPLLNEAHRWYEENLAGSQPDPWLWEAREHWDEEYRAEVRAWLARADPYVAMLARAAQRPVLRQDYDWAAGADLRIVTIPAMQGASAVLGRRVSLAETASPQALGELALLLDLAAKVERQVLIGTLVRWTLHAVATDALEDLARKPGFDAAQARALLDGRLAATDEGVLLREAFHGERALHLDTCRRWIAGENPRRLLLQYTIMSAEEREEQVRREVPLEGLLGSWIVRPFAYRDALRVHDLFAEALEIVEAPPWEARRRATELTERYDTGPPSLFSSLCANGPLKAVMEWQRHAARIRVARVGLALLELRQETGAWPRSLDAVVHLVAAETLVDPFHGGQLRYVPGEILSADAPVPEGYEEMRDEFEIAWRFR